jgi:hypothetical protein
VVFRKSQRKTSLSIMMIYPVLYHHETRVHWL